MGSSCIACFSSHSSNSHVCRCDSLIDQTLCSLIVLVTMDTTQSNEVLVTKLVIGITSNWNVCLFRNTASSQDRNETLVTKLVTRV